MKAKIYQQVIYPECGLMLYALDDFAGLQCKNEPCGLSGILFEWPTVELKPVEVSNVQKD